MESFLVFPMSVAKYNQLQWDRYGDYVARCVMNNVPFEPKDRYFPGITVKYGFIMEGACNAVYWKRLKSQFDKD